MLRRLFVVAVGTLFLITSCKKKENLNRKTLNFVISSKISTLDPINASDVTASKQVQKVYDCLYQYHYLKRPYEIEPCLADSMPKVSEDGTVYRIKVKEGVFFQDNPCFPSGIGREMKAVDARYSLLRLADPKLHARGWWTLQGQVKGLDEWREKYASLDSANYDDEIEGLKVLNDYELQITLNHPYPQFVNILAMSYTVVVAKEAVEFYGDDFLNNPVGTGPYVMGRYAQGNKLVFVRNPKYREEYYPSEGEDDDVANGYLDAKGTRLPILDSIIMKVQLKDQPAWLSFVKGKYDAFGIPKDNFNMVVNMNRTLKEHYTDREFELKITPAYLTSYFAFNHDDELFGKNVHLRRAMSLAFDRVEFAKKFTNNRSVPSRSICPPGLMDDDTSKYVFTKLNIEKAKEEMKLAGYPGGKGLPPITIDIVADKEVEKIAEYFKICMKEIGVEIEMSTNTWPKLIDKVNKKQTQMFAMAWKGDYPDAQTFLQLLYGPNESPGCNSSNYKNAYYDSLFEKASRMQVGTERDALYKEMNAISANDVPLILSVHGTSYSLNHAWLKNYKPHAFGYGMEKYLDIDLAKKKEIFNDL